MGIEDVALEDFGGLVVFFQLVREGIYIYRLIIHYLIDHLHDILSLSPGNGEQVFIKSISNCRIKPIASKHNQISAIEPGAKLGRGAVGDIAQPDRAFASRNQVIKNLHKFYTGFYLIDFHGNRADNWVNPELFIGNAQVICPHHHLGGEHSSFISISGHTAWSPEHADNIGIKFFC